MRIAYIRGVYLNNFELQSYYPILQNKDIELTGFTSLHPLHQVKIPTKNLLSPTDIPNFPYKLPILNRLFVDALYLSGLPKALIGYDIAHARETYFHFTKQAIDAKLKGYVKKVLVTCSETIPHNHETIWGRKKFKQYVVKHADHFHALTNKAKQSLIEEGVKENKITVIPYGVDLKIFHPNHNLPSKQKNKIQYTKYNILFVGRIEEQKGIYELINAHKMLKADFPNLKLNVVGKGPLEWLLKGNGINAKQYSYDQMPKVFQQADILVHPPKPDKYWEEYLGMVLLEAMSSGLPIVTTNCGAIPEVVGSAAQVVQYGSSGSLYDGIKFLIEKPDWRKKLASRGIERVQTKFSTTKQADKLYKLYTKVHNS